jgi:predicted short-subunit dehydrogenase-like oxidoreductase (DUF2520 family)
LPVLRLIGPGRAGRSLVAALGWPVAPVAPVLGRGDDVREAAHGVDALVIATPDAAVADVAAAVEPAPACVVLHLSGSLGLDVLAPHVRRASVHPLVALPDADPGRLDGAWFAVAGDPMAGEIVAALHGRAIDVPDDRRVLYHAAAVIASNHLVALLAQAERVAAAAGVPFEAYRELVRTTVDNVFTLGPAGALTGPVKRGDWATVERHLAALDPAERPAYAAMVEEARKCA